jgi:hypothetical protein
MPAIKQYQGTTTFHGISGVDLNVLSANEAAKLTNGGIPPVDDAERKQMQDKIDGLVSSLGYIGGDVLKPLTRPTAAKYVQTAVAQIRAVCDQQDISHA